jgi:hypothetical protein
MDDRLAQITENPKIQNRKIKGCGEERENQNIIQKKD